MLDTNICSYIMRQSPVQVLAALDERAVRGRIVISVITYAELRFGAVGKKASPKSNHMIDEFMLRVDGGAAMGSGCCRCRRQNQTNPGQHWQFHWTQ